MKSYKYMASTALYYGVGSFGALGQIMEEMRCESAVVVCGKHFAHQAQAMKKTNPAVSAVYHEVESNPQLRGVEEIIRRIRSCSADAVIAIGGGSVMDSAKFAAVLAEGDLSAEEYYDGVALPARGLPVIAVPTTAGTGSEVSRAVVISRGDEKKTFFSDSCLPTAAIIDPAMSAGVPPRAAVISGLDALSHALESFWSVKNQPICDLYATQAVRLVLNSLRTTWTEPENLEARGDMALAALLAGLSFAQTKNAACHACSYPLSERYHIPHGEACAFTLGCFVRINRDERLEKLCREAGIGSSGALAEWIEETKRMAGLHRRLSEFDNVDIDRLVDECLQQPLLANNPVAMTREKLTEMFESLR